MSGTPAGTAPPREYRPSPEPLERALACLAMVGFTLCSMVGPLLTLWWAKRHKSVFVERYSLASLAYDGAVFALFVLCLPVLTIPSALVQVIAFGVAALFEIALIPVTLALAARAWTGTDVGGRLVPQVLLRRLPSAPADRA